MTNLTIEQETTREEASYPLTPNVEAPNPPTAPFRLRKKTKGILALAFVGTFLLGFLIGRLGSQHLDPPPSLVQFPPENEIIEPIEPPSPTQSQVVQR